MGRGGRGALFFERRCNWNHKKTKRGVRRDTRVARRVSRRERWGVQARHRTLWISQSNISCPVRARSASRSTGGAVRAARAAMTRELYSMPMISSASTRPEAATTAVEHVVSIVATSAKTEHALPIAPTADVASIMGVISSTSS